MYASADSATSRVSDEATFTMEEAERLRTLRERFAIQPSPRELDLDEHQLLFLRWLAAHGEFSDDMHPARPAAMHACTTPSRRREAGYPAA